MLISKFCNLCENVLNIDEFHYSKKQFRHTCKECSKVWRKAYTQKNREKLNAKKREYVRKYPEKKKQSDARYHSKHKLERNLINKTYKQENKERFNAWDRSYYQENKAQRVQYSRDFRKAFPNDVRKTYLKHKYKLTLEQFNKMLDEQNGKCALCQKEHSGRKDRKSLFVDHCHKTNKVRGLLCNKCNCGLGNFQDNTDYLQSAIDYLKKNS